MTPHIIDLTLVEVGRVIEEKTRKYGVYDAVAQESVTGVGGRSLRRQRG